MAKSAKIASFFDIPQSPEVETSYTSLAQKSSSLAGIIRTDYGSRHLAAKVKLPPLRSHDDLRNAMSTEVARPASDSSDGGKSRRRSNTTIKEKFRKVFGRSVEQHEALPDRTKLQKTIQQQSKNSITDRPRLLAASKSCPVSRPQTPESICSSFLSVEKHGVRSITSSQASPKSKRDALDVGPHVETALSRTRSQPLKSPAVELSPVAEDGRISHRPGSPSRAQYPYRLEGSRSFSRRDTPSDSSADTVRPRTSHSETVFRSQAEPGIRIRTGSEPVVGFAQISPALSPALSSSTRKGSVQTATRSAMEARSIAARLAQLEERLGQVELKLHHLDSRGDRSKRSRSGNEGSIPSRTNSPQNYDRGLEKCSSEQSWLSRQSSQASLQTPLTSPASSVRRDELSDEISHEALAIHNAMQLLSPDSKTMLREAKPYLSAPHEFNARPSSRRSPHTASVEEFASFRFHTSSSKEGVHPFANSSRKIPRSRLDHSLRHNEHVQFEEILQHSPPKRRPTPLQLNPIESPKSNRTLAHRHVNIAPHMTLGSRFSAFDTDDEASIAAGSSSLSHPIGSKLDVAHTGDDDKSTMSISPKTALPPRHWAWQGEDDLAVAL